MGAGKPRPEVQGSNRASQSNPANFFPARGDGLRKGGTGYAGCKSGEDAKENKSEKAGGKSPAPIRKPWVSPNAKVSSGVSPKTRILLERNEARRTLLSPSTVKDVGAHTQPENVPKVPKRTASESPDNANARLADVADLQKRIQRFLDDQQNLVGVTSKHPFGFDENRSLLAPSSCPSEECHPPYRAIDSPFSTVPQFVGIQEAEKGRVNGFGENDEPVPDDPKRNLLLSAFDALVTSPGHNLRNPEFQEPAVPRKGNKMEEVQLTFPKRHCVEVATTNAEATISGLTETATSAKNLPEVEAINVSHAIEEGEAILTSKEQPQFDGKGMGEHLITPGVEILEDAQLAELAHNTRDSKNLIGNFGLEDGEEEPYASWSQNLGRWVLCILFLAIFGATVVLASGSPGLLPSPLRNNALSLIWHGSRYHQPTSQFLNGMDGLWDLNFVDPSFYLPIDIHYLLQLHGDLSERGCKLLQVAYTFISRQSGNSVLQMVRVLHLMKENVGHFTQNLRFVFKEIVWNFRSWGQILLRELFLKEGTELENGYLDEMVDISEWEELELTREYDVETANKLSMDSISENEISELKESFLQLKEAPEVQFLLSDTIESPWKTKEQDFLQENRNIFETGIGRSPIDVVFHYDDLFFTSKEASSLEGSSDRALSATEQKKTEIPLQAIQLPESTPVSFYMDAQEDENMHQIIGSNGELEIENKAPRLEGDRTCDVIGLRENVLHLDTCFTEGLQQASVVNNKADPIPSEKPEKSQQLHVVIPAGADTNAFRSIWQFGIFIVPSVAVAALIATLFVRMQPQNIPKLPSRAVEFLKKGHSIGSEVNSSIDKSHLTPVATMYTAESNPSQWKSPVIVTEGADVSQAPAGTFDSPSFGRFTTYVFAPKKEGESSDSGKVKVITPVRRSNRIRNRMMSPGLANHIALSPP